MNISKYNKSIIDLYNKQQEYLQLLDPRVLDVLNQLLKKAKAIKDDELIGYTYHSLAFVEYFVLGNYDLFLKNLNLSAKYLLKVENSPEILHVYYLVAIDALNKGIHDLSYYYFMIARNVAIETKQETAAAILNENIGHVLMLLGSYKDALSFLKLSLKGIKKNPKHPHYYNNVASCYMNQSECYLNLNKLREAEELYKKTKAFMLKHPEDFQLDAQINFSLIGARIAIKKKNKKQISNRVEELLKLNKKITQAANYINDLRKLVFELLELKEYDLAGKLINSISKKNLASDATSAQRNLIEAKIAYYKATNKKKKLLEAYLKQDEILNSFVQEQRKNYVLSQDLISLTNELQKQREETEKARKELESSANTDALTGIANRFKINSQIDHYFEEAYHRKTNFGIGVLDLDGLKILNDEKGHQAGDKIIIKCAKVLKELEKNRNIFVSRYGGDEFVILFTDMENKDIKKTINQLISSTDIKFSIGICNDIPQYKQKPWDYLLQADKQLYSVKNKKNKKKDVLDIAISKYK